MEEGLPCGAYGGKKEIMNHVAPLGDVYQAGTLSGNPLVVQAGITSLSKIKTDQATQKAINMTKTLSDSLKKELKQQGFKYQVNQCGSMFCLFLTEKPVRNLTDVNTCDLRCSKTFTTML